MALPTLDKTWRFNINNKQATAVNAAWHKSMMLDLKNILANTSPPIAWDTTPTGIWTVAGSGDSTAAGMDATDRWTTTGDLIWDRPGDPHSWIVFDTGMNGGSAQVLIDLDNNNNATADSQPESIRVAISPGGNYTGGSTTDAPTASDETNEITIGTTVGWWAGGQTSNGVDSAFHVLMSSDGAELRIFMLNNNVCYTIWAIGEAADAPPSAAHNLYGSIWSTSTQAIECGSTHDATNGWLHGSSDNVRGVGNFHKFVYLNYVHSSGNVSLWNAATVPGVGDEVEGETVFGEISMWDTDSAGVRGPKGRLKDIWLVTNARANGDTFPANGTRQFHKVAENIAVPWDGTIPENAF